jgi:hypothetical protein
MTRVAVDLDLLQMAYDKIAADSPYPSALLDRLADALYLQEQKQEPVAYWHRDLWHRRADEEFLKEYEKRYGKREPATDEQVAEADESHEPSWPDYRDGWRDAERFHGIGGSK